MTGSVTLNSIQSGSSWLLKDSVGNYTTDLNGATSGSGTQFTDADESFTLTFPGQGAGSDGFVYDSFGLRGLPFDRVKEPSE